ncbi:MAG: hypothetical protein AAF462_04220 [Thermodesulfobacteriota bacterium]
MFRSFILFAGLVLALGLAACPQQAQEPAGDAEVTEEEVVIESAPADDAADAASDAADDASDAANDAMDDAKDAANDAMDDASDAANDTMDDAKDKTGY